ncbi:MAG: hypothetical protein PHU80_02540 [Kiritimatiellae bacterium]|nr:hypothetical protein [Kiritimatiellia bacterium]
MKFPFSNLRLKASSQDIRDVVGLELGAGLKQGVPAVRLLQKDGETEVVAAGFIDLNGILPSSPEDAAAAGSGTWQLPHEFKAPRAAIAINSKQAFLRHAVDASEEGEDKNTVAFRRTKRATADDLPPLTAGLPEFQAAWAARLFPEGHKPTAFSVQIAATAAMSGFLRNPAFKQAGGNAIAMLVFAEHTALAAFQDTALVLYREQPTGFQHIRNAISSEMHIDNEMADSLLNDTLVDPTTMIEPILRPLFRQVEISVDYLSRRRNCPVENFFIYGLPTGLRYWSIIFKRMMSKTLTPCQPLEGLAGADSLPELAETAPLMMTAAGAACAVLDDIA